MALSFDDFVKINIQSAIFLVFEKSESSITLLICIAPPRFNHYLAKIVPSVP
jgi:hypothetical protein